ncbi:MAG: hypothetical protein R3C18_07100 [Planctomycetaceae bacterium]
MNQPTGKRRSRGMNYLSMLGAKLRDLQGTATLVHELTQNAEDAVGYIERPNDQNTTLVFRLDETALIVENQGVFTDCGELDKVDCPWQKPCDFHGMTSVGSGRKRLIQGQKGAFGFGFTAVYQVTDNPEFISSGRHWILEDDKPENERILECGGCDRCHAQGLPGTRFILPWAKNCNSSIRQALKVAAVPPDGPQKFLKELLDDIPHTLLFLDHIKAIEVYWKDQLKLRVSRQHEVDHPSVTRIVQNGTATRWMILSANFEEQAAQLRANHPPGEKKPISTVKVAIPDNTSTIGLFFAFLPTQQPTGFPFHINADFFPTNDRKRILLESDYQAEWNREAIRTAAVALKDGLLELRSFLGPKAFWQLLNEVHRLSTAESYAENPVCQDYWELLVPTLKSEAVIPTTSGQWMPASGVRYLRRKTDDDTAALYRALGVQTVDADLSEFGQLLRSKAVGVRELDAEALASAMRKSGLSGSKQLNQMPTWFQEIEHWEILWSHVKSFSKSEQKTQGGSDRKVLGPIGQHHATHNPLAHCALVKCTDGHFRNCADVYVVDQETRELFKPLKPSFHFAGDNQAMIDAVRPLCNTFTLREAIGAVETALPEVLKAQYKPLLKWLTARSEELKDEVELLARTKALPICPTGNGLRPFSTVVLPGGFSDPVGVTDLVDEHAIESIEPLLQILQLDKLSLPEYITERLPKAFSSGEITPEAAIRLVELLASHQGEFLDDEEIREELASLPFIQCEDRKVRSVKDGLYFPTALVQDVLNDSVYYISRAYSTRAIQNFLKWLGVSSEPDLERVTKYLLATTSKADAPNAETIRKVQSLFEHLGSRLDEVLNQGTILRNLRSSPWLPSSVREWCAESKKWIDSKNVQWSAPQQTHFSKCHYLVESVAHFLAFAPWLQDRFRHFLIALGVVVLESVKPNDVVRHLGKAADLGAAIDRRLYQFLNLELDNRSITEQEFRLLKNSPCLYYEARAACVKPSHCFTQKNPFGTHRILLDSDTVSSFKNLLKALEVRPEPSWKDAIDVLCEIASSETVRLNCVVSGDDKKVVMKCWRMIESALRDESQDRDAIHRKIESIAKDHVVCRQDNLMSEPGRVFFRDREHLAEAFLEQLSGFLIPVPPGAAEALRHAGVKRLSDVTTIKPLFGDRPLEKDIEVSSRLKERAPLLIRVLETCKATSGKGIPEFDDLAVSEVSALNVQYSFHGFERTILSEISAAVAIFDESKNHIYYCRESGRVPWDALACEIARMFLGSGAVSQLSAQIIAVLEPDTFEAARRKLCRLGFPDIDSVEDESVASSTPDSFRLGEIKEGQAELVKLPTLQATVEGTGTIESASTPFTNVSPADGATTSRESQKGTLSRIVTQENQAISSTGRPNSVDADRNEQHGAPQRALSAQPNSNLFSNDTGEFESDDDNDDDLADRSLEELLMDALAGPTGGSDRRLEKVAAESELADRRRSEQVWRQNRVNRIPKSEVENYLLNYYSKNGRLYCQMRHAHEPHLHPMPFRKKNGKECWVRVELLNGKWAKKLKYDLPEYKCLFILLCPNCAALYTEFVRNLDTQQDRLFEWFATSDETTFRVKCSLAGAQLDRMLHFNPKHIADIRAVKQVKANSK